MALPKRSQLIQKWKRISASSETLNAVQGTADTSCKRCKGKSTGFTTWKLKYEHVFAEFACPKCAERRLLLPVPNTYAPSKIGLSPFEKKKEEDRILWPHNYQSQHPGGDRVRAANEAHKFCRDGAVFYKKSTQEDGFRDTHEASGSDWLIGVQRHQAIMAM